MEELNGLAATRYLPLTATGSVPHPRAAPDTSLEASQTDQSANGTSTVRKAKAGKAAPKKARTRTR